MRSRILRLSAASLLAVAAAITVAPHATHHISTAAMVNAPLIRISAPFDGRVVVASQAAATAPKVGEPLLEVAAQRPETGEVEALAARLKSLQARDAALSGRMERLERMREELRRRLARHLEIAGRWAEAERRRMQAATRAAAARQARMAAELERAQRLSARGLMTEAELDGTRARARALAAELARRRAEAAVLAARTEAVMEGAPIDAGDGGGLDLRRRLDDLRLRLVDLRGRRAAARGRLAALETQLAAARSALEARRSFGPAATEGRVVWRASPDPGTPVSREQVVLELLDCRRRFIEVSLPERHFERIRPGDAASVRLKGGADSFEARVEAVGGAGVWRRTGRAAAPRPQTGAGELHAVLRLDPADATRPEVAATYCDVGRSAQVRFEREALPQVERLAETIARAAARLGLAAWAGMTADAGEPGGEAAP
jgi:multidrug resistance efflux pump